MGCGSSSSSGTEQSNKVKNQQVVSKQEVGVNYNPTAAVIKSSNGQLSSVKTTNNDQSVSQGRTITSSKVKSRDLKLNYDDFKDIDEHARQVMI